MRTVLVVLVGLVCLGAAVPEQGSTVHFSLPLDMMAFAGDVFLGGGNAIARTYQPCAPFTIAKINKDGSKMTVADPAGFVFFLRGAWSARMHITAVACSEDAAKRPGARVEWDRSRYSLVEPQPEH